MPKDTGHGGRRPGAGRRATDTDETLTPYTLTLRLTDVGTLNRIGEGNLSRGLRRLIDRGNATGLIPPVMTVPGPPSTPDGTVLLPPWSAPV